MADTAPASPVLDAGAASSLAALAGTLIDALPALLERGLRHDVENSILRDQCAELATRVALVREDIRLERAKQIAARAQIAKLRAGGVQAKASSGKLKAASIMADAEGNTSEDKENDFVDISLVSEGSPISLRSKRKGRVFPDDMRIVKRMRLESSSD
ncbi:hypothetical protein PsYK624_091840 [Phanerochaete sordida]|uniref:Uncharacterized protein n=1 Tax=Phanerochaete sordida TaxID=48140 RepID=A0A9P3LF76_9APHY|nr:hypothetical protein PsYK624_091840 [Phanerochaete sordida]